MGGSASGLKTCFVIAPIGEESSPTRKRSDQVLKHIISPPAAECGYQPIRADQMSQPGLITSQVIQHIVEDPLVIADLTERNANVFYELSLRHAIGKPVVQIIHIADAMPFDVAASRTIKFDHQNLDSVEAAKEQIAKQIRAVEKNPHEVDTPISVAVDLRVLQRSDNPIARSNADILNALQVLGSELRDQRMEMLERREVEVSRLRHELAALSAHEAARRVQIEAAVKIVSSIQDSIHDEELGSRLASHIADLIFLLSPS